MNPTRTYNSPAQHDDEAEESDSHPTRDSSLTLWPHESRPAPRKAGHYRTECYGMVYLVEHEEMDAYKVGVTNSRYRRVDEHKQREWTLVDSWTYSDGRVALNIERAILGGVRSRGFSILLSDADMPQGGWRETLSRSSIARGDLFLLIEDAVTRFAGPQRQLQLDGI
jgi:hypothetical protein